MKRIINFWLCGVLIVATISACSDRAKLERDVKLIQSSPIDLCMDSLYRYSTNGGEIWAECAGRYGRRK